MLPYKTAQRLTDGLIWAPEMGPKMEITMQTINPKPRAPAKGASVDPNWTPQRQPLNINIAVPRNSPRNTSMHFLIVTSVKQRAIHSKLSSLWKIYIYFSNPLVLALPGFHTGFGLWFRLFQMVENRTNPRNSPLFSPVPHRLFPFYYIIVEHFPNDLFHLPVNSQIRLAFTSTWFQILSLVVDRGK